LGNLDLGTVNGEFRFVGGVELVVRNIWWGVIEQFKVSSKENKMFRIWKQRKPKKEVRLKLRRPNSRSMRQAMEATEKNEERGGWLLRGDCLSHFRLKLNFCLA